MGFVENYGLYDYEKEYTQIQKNVKAYWLASTKEEKLDAYCKFKTALAIYKIKKKISIIDFSEPQTEQQPNGFTFKKNSIVLVQEHLHSMSLIDKVVNMYVTEMMDDILDLYSAEEVNAAYTEYSKDKLCLN